MGKNEFVTKNEFDDFKRNLRKDKKEDRRDNLSPLKIKPLYLDQIKEAVREGLKGFFKKERTAALKLKRLYFVNEDYEKLLVTSANVAEGGSPARFTGQLEAIPIEGDILRTDDNSRRFEVIRREHILYQASTRPEKIFIVLREIT